MSRTVLTWCVCLIMAGLMCEGFRLHPLTEESLELQPKSVTDPSVGHFATHYICQDRTGKVIFYNAMKSKMCRMSDAFVVNYVVELCKTSDSMLHRWVAEVFDLDGDGRITPWEMQLHFTDSPK